MPRTEQPRIGITELWHSTEPQVWEHALKLYWSYVLDSNRAVEEALDKLDLARIRRMNPQEWYDFLRDEYFRWKYTDKRRYATTTDGTETARGLRHYVDSDSLEDLYRVKEQLLVFDLRDIRMGLSIAKKIIGLGVPGASGLLSLMYPGSFGTVDQFAVKALYELKTLPEASAVSAMMKPAAPDPAKKEPKSLSIKDGVLLIGIMRRKAAENNALFASAAWTPRKIDQILWTYGRPIVATSGKSNFRCVT